MPDVVITITADTAITATDRVVLVNSTSNPITVTLPTPAVALRHSIKDYGSSGLGFSGTNPVNVDPGANSIDGVPGPRLLNNNEGLNLISNGVDWGVVV